MKMKMNRYTITHRRGRITKFGLYISTSVSFETLNENGVRKKVMEISKEQGGEILPGDDSNEYVVEENGEYVLLSIQHDLSESYSLTAVELINVVKV